MKTKILERLYKSLLNEIDLGEFEFAPARIDLDDVDEPNTQEEERLFDAIIRWVDSTIQFTPENIDALRAAMSHPKYSQFFREPSPETIVYRGFRVPDQTLRRWLGGVDDIPDTGEAKGSWVMRPRAGNYVASYSHDPVIATDFTTFWDEKSNDSHVVVSARVGDNPGGFLDLYSILDTIGPDHLEVDPNDEKEILAIKPINVNHIWWSRHGEDDWGPDAW